MWILGVIAEFVLAGWGCPCCQLGEAIAEDREERRQIRAEARKEKRRKQEARQKKERDAARNRLPS